MLVRRTLAAVLTAGALFLAAGCAGDDLASDDATEPAESSAAADKGSVTIAGQNFPEATLVASMYQQLLEDAGYTVDTKLVDSRDAYMPTFPDSVDIVPEYVGGIVNFLNTQENGGDAKPLRGRRRRAARRRRRRPARGRGHHAARRLARDRHQRVLRDAGVQRVRGRHDALRPRGQVGHPRRGSRLRGAPRLRGRPLRRIRHRRHGGPAARLRQRPDLPVGARRRVRARRDQHHRRHARVPGPRRPRGRQADPAGAEPRAGRRRRLPRRARRRRRHPQPADGGADHGER